MSESRPEANLTPADLEPAAAMLARAMTEMGKRMVGQRHLLDRLLMALVADGHVLLEGLPGLAKTTAIRTLGDVCTLGFSRIQFTPDLLPADVIGTQIYDPRTGEFKVKRGPVFANLILADEINRAPAKVQSALLEAMQERQVTIGTETFRLAQPFLVLATQNPIEQEGTYPLPEAQIDRFLFKVNVGYGTEDEEMEIIARATTAHSAGDPVAVVSKSDIAHLREIAARVHVSDKIRRYIVQLVFATREPKRFGLAPLEPLISCGASPRASINLEKAARVSALMAGRAYVTPQDIKDVGRDVLRHRILMSWEAEAEKTTTDQVIGRIFDRVAVP